MDMTIGLEALPKSARKRQKAPFSYEARIALIFERVRQESRWGKTTPGKVCVYAMPSDSNSW